MSTQYRSGYDEAGGPMRPQISFPTPTPVVKKLLLFTTIAFVIQYIIGWRPAGEAWVVDALGLSPRIWGEFLPFVPVWQVFSYGFLHGGAGHLLSNLLLLYFFGTMLEEILGGERFLVVYLTAMAAGAGLHLVAEPLFGQGAPAIGASGAALGIMVAAAVLRPNATVILLFVPVALKWVAIGIVAIDAFALLEQWRRGVQDYTAHYVHLGGAAYGFLAARRGWIWKDPIQTVRAKRAIRDEERRVTDETRMDALLGKIHDEGLNSLSRGEKEFLKRMSKRR